MELLIGTSEGVFIAGGSGLPVSADGLAGRCVRALRASNGSLFAGADNGVFRSRDGGRSWQMSGVEGQVVWDIAAAPQDDRLLYAGTQPAALYRTRDGGDSWMEIDSIKRAPGKEHWGLPNSDLGARARTIVLDPTNPTHYWVGLEVGGVLATVDDGASWTCVLPGGDPDIHVMACDPERPNIVFATTGFGRTDNSEPMERRIAGLFGSEDGGRTWRYLWENIQPRYTRPMCIDPRPPHAVAVGCAPSAFSSFKDPGGAKSMLYQSTDGGNTFRSLGDADHSPSAANILAVEPAADETGSVLAGTDTGEVWRVSPESEWTLLASGLPMVQTVLQLA